MVARNSSSSVARSRRQTSRPMFIWMMANCSALRSNRACRSPGVISMARKPIRVSISCFQPLEVMGIISRMPW